MFTIIRSGFKVLFCRFKKNRTLTTVSILGQVIAITSCILMALIVYSEQQFDAHIPNIANKFLVVHEPSGGEGSISQWPLPTTPYHVADTIKRHYEGVKSSARILFMPWTWVRCEKGHKIIDPITVAMDDDGARMLGLKPLHGDIREALSQPFSVIISNDAAQKLFGKTNVIGRKVLIDSEAEYVATINAVVKEMPENSSLKPSLYVSFSTLRHVEDDQYSEIKGDVSRYFTFVELTDNSSPKQFKRAFQRLAEEMGLQLSVMKIRNARLFHQLLWNVEHHALSSIVLVIGAVLTFILLVTAWINCINLSTMQSHERHKEIGIKKALGASRTSIIIQIFSEAFFLCITSLILSVALAELCLPIVSQLLDRTLSFNYLDLTTLCALLLLVIISALLNAIFPILQLARLNPLAAIRGRRIGKEKARVRMYLIVLQFSFAIFFIIGAAVAFFQLKHIQKTSLTAGKDPVVYYVYAFPTRVQGANKTIREHILEHPSIAAITNSWCPSGAPCRIRQDHYINPELHQTKPLEIATNIVDHSYFEAHQMQVLWGRAFEKHRAEDISSLVDFNEPMDFSYTDDGRLKFGRGHLIVTEDGAKKLGFTHPKDAIGQIIHKLPIKENDPRHATLKIIGVVSTKMRSPHAVAPLPDMFLYYDAAFGTLSVRISGNIDEALLHVRRTWDQFLPNAPILRSTISEMHSEIYRSMYYLIALFSMASVFAILIACMGLYVISELIVKQRSQEMAIRKATGASNRDVIRLMLNGFMQPVLTANVIAWPLAYFVNDYFLRTAFSSNISIDPAIFAITATATLLLSLTTVLFRCNEASKQAPASALRYE